MAYARRTKLPTSACDWHYGGAGGYGNPVDLIRERLGIKGTKIPRSMHGEYKIDGWNIVVKRGPTKGSRKSSKHRIFVRHNGDLVPAGRVRQALCKTDIHHARKRAARSRGPKGRFEYKRYR